MKERFRELGRKLGFSQCFIYITLFGFNKKQMIQLQGVNKLFYTRVAQWIRFVTIIRLSEPVCINTRSTENFVFPSAAMLREWCGVLHTLVGFANEKENGSGIRFNFILSNGTRSTQSDQGWENEYNFMIPSSALNKIRSITIHYFNFIYGFSFFDKDKKLIGKHGFTTWLGLKKQTVLLTENEVIFGVKAKLY